jgi:protein SCO1/2
LASSRRYAWIVVAAFAVFTPISTFAEDRAEPLPLELQGVGVTEHPGAELPLDRPFLDQDGKRVTLRDLFGHGKPLIVTFNYSSCPMLCHVQRDGLIESLKRLDWTPGREFDVVSIGIDPRETPERSATTRRATLKAYGRPEAATGWRFLVGREEDIRATADAAGFGYRYIPSRDEYAHSAALVICTPDGRVSRYLYGVQYEPNALKRALGEAVEGKTTSTSALEQILMYCFHYDPSTRRYAPAAMNIMRLGGGLATLGLLTFLVRSWTRDRAREPHEPPSDAHLNEAAV